MSATVIDGRVYARRLEDTLIDEVKELGADGVSIGLATVLVGEDYGSAAYERRLRRLADELDVPYEPRRLPDTATESDLLAAVAELNASPTVSGILILRPLPPHVDEATVCRTIAPEKDIEAVHPENAGLLALGVPRFVPSTAASSSTWWTAGSMRPGRTERYCAPGC